MTKLRLGPEVAALNPGLGGVVEIKAPAKYGNRRVVAHGLAFDSAREAAVYGELLLRQAAGEIRDLSAHPRYVLEAHGAVLGYYEADAAYLDLQTGMPVVVDVKSNPTRTAVYRLKRKIFEAQYAPMKITEVE